MYCIHEQKNWHEVGHSRWIVADKNGNFVLGTYSKPVADICLRALESPADIKEAASTSTNSRVIPCQCPLCNLRAEGCDLDNDGVNCQSFRART